jgi:uncharacterized membrane protein YbaN (DUF454 family)
VISAEGKHLLLLTVGTVCVIIGGVALLVPILPTTPFLLVAAACYAKSSRRFYDWLLNSRLFGKLIRNYREKGGMTRRQKAISFAIFLPAVVGSFLFSPGGPWARVVLGVFALVMVVCLLRVKTVADE